MVGCTVAAAARRAGADVLLLDDARPMPGSRASGGHLKPSWLGGMKKSEYEPAMKLLDEVWGLSSEEFVIYPLRVVSTTVYRVDPDAVAAYPRTEQRVTGIHNLEGNPEVRWNGGGARCRCLVVATGSWAGELVPELKISGKMGVSFRFKGKLNKPFIKAWAPYKQVVAHQQSEEEVWVGDGSALLTENWTAERTDECMRRCRNTLPVGMRGLEPAKVIHGIRPYCAIPDGQPCLIHRLGPNAWAVTGAGKLGTIAAGWAAGRLVNEAE